MESCLHFTTLLYPSGTVVLTLNLQSCDWTLLKILPSLLIVLRIKSKPLIWPKTPTTSRLCFITICGSQPPRQPQ